MTDARERPRPAGRGWFIAATVLLALVGGLHTFGQFTPEEPELAPAIAAMRAARLPIMGMAPSMWDIFRSIAFTMSVTFFALAAFDAVVVWHRDTTASLLRQAAALNVVWLAAFIVLCWFYAVPPPLVSGLGVAPFFLIAWLRIR